MGGLRSASDPSSRYNVRTGAAAALFFCSRACAANSTNKFWIKSTGFLIMRYGKFHFAILTAILNLYFLFFIVL